MRTVNESPSGLAMENIWRHSTGAARRALVFGSVALSLFAFPFLWTFVFRSYAEALGLFAVLYLVFALPATVSAVVASRRGQWWHPDGGRKFLCALYGLPILLVLLAAGWAMKR